MIGLNLKLMTWFWMCSFYQIQWFRNWWKGNIQKVCKTKSLDIILNGGSANLYLDATKLKYRDAAELIPSNLPKNTQRPVK